MKLNRRHFLQTTVAAGLASSLGRPAHATTPGEPIFEKLDQAAARPVLKKELFPDPVIIESVDLLNYNDNYMIRVRSQDGAEGYCIGHNIRMPHLYPIQLMLVNPFLSVKTPAISMSLFWMACLCTRTITSTRATRCGFRWRL